MKRIMQAKNKVTFLLLFAILVLCIGFIFVACGVGPVTKGVNNDRGNFALDTTDCPGGRTSCTANATATDTAYSMNSIQGKPLTLEAWIKPKVTTTAFILAHIQSRGAALKVAAVSTTSTSCNATGVGVPTVYTFTSAHGHVVGQELSPTSTLAGCGITAGTSYYVCTVPAATTMTIATTAACGGTTVTNQAGDGTDVTWSGLSSVTPMFEIRRSVFTVGGGGTATSSVPYTVSGSVIDLDAWTHIAGILTNDDHSAVGGHPVCADVAVVGADPHIPDGDATNDPWHLDIYLNGVINACAETYGNVTDPTFAAVAFADAPGAKQVNIQAQGIVDETRIWTTDDRTILDCMNQELGTSGTCDRTDSNLLSYLRFNAGAGHSVMDEAGIFAGAGLVYILAPDNFPSWDTGWTSDTPF